MYSSPSHFPINSSFSRSPYFFNLNWLSFFACFESYSSTSPVSVPNVGNSGRRGCSIGASFGRFFLFGVRKTNFYKVFKNFNSKILISIPLPCMMSFLKSQSKVHNEYLLLHTFLFVGLCNNFLKLVHCFLRRVPESWRVEFLVNPR